MLKKACKIWLVVLFSLAARTVWAEPSSCPPVIKALLGYYQAEGDVLLIRERQGQIEMLYKEAGQRNLTFARSNLFQMSRERYDEYLLQAANPRDWRLTVSVKFERDKEGRGITCILDKQRFTRMFMPGEDGGEPFSLTLPRPLDSLRREALAASLPVEKTANLLTARLVDVTDVDPAIRANLIYAADENAVGAALYDANQAFLDVAAARALSRVSSKLASHGYGLIVWDAYRPWYISKMYYDILPEDKKDMLEAPETGSPHNRGLSVDVTLYSLSTGQEVSMPSSFDEPSPRSYGAFAGGGELERYRRDLLAAYMAGEGFTGVEHEWWHFSYKNFTGYRLLNSKFNELREEKSVTG